MNLQKKIQQFNTINPKKVTPGIAMANIITLTGQMEVRAEKEREFIIIIKEVIAKIRKHKGCLSYGIYQNIEMEKTYSIIGTWKSPAAAKLSFQSDEFAILLTAFDLLLRPPEVRYLQVLYPNGVKVIRALRNNLGENLEAKNSGH